MRRRRRRTATVTVPGDVWVLGEHRLLCGDATDGRRGEGAGRRAGGHAFTDPPYNVAYEGKTGEQAED